MFQRLVSHNDDVRRLVERGFAVAFDSNYLVVRDIPYLNGARDLCWGAIVTKLVFVDENTLAQENHQIFFAGDSPHGVDGHPIPNMGDRAATLALSEACADVQVQRSFSNKPKDTGQFKDFFEKIDSYVTIISGPAIALHGANPHTFRAVKEVVEDTIFKFNDTLTSRAEIVDLAAKFKDDVIAIIGLGGTGAYILDFLVKTPVREIRAFDADFFHVHTAFRSPGRVETSEFGKKKTEVYDERYCNFRHGLTTVAKFVGASSAEDFRGVTFAFVCVDKGESRAGILDLLISKGIPFIDVGMGLNRKHGPIGGMLRVTSCSPQQALGIRDRRLAPLDDDADDVYRANIQISELNALNACLAVLKFKQLRGFYVADSTDCHFLFDISDLRVTGIGA